MNFRSVLTVFALSLALSSHASSEKNDMNIETLIRGEFGLNAIGVDFSMQKTEFQRKNPLNKINLEDAVRLAIKSFFNDGSDGESVYNNLWEGAVANLYRGLPRTPELLKLKVRTTKMMIRDHMNRRSAKISLVYYEPEGGESVQKNWIIRLYVGDISDHVHYAVIDRTGKQPVYNYGFNVPF